MASKVKKITALVMVVVVIYLTALSAVAVVDHNGTGGLKVINASDGLLLTWDAVSGAKGYRVNKYDPITGKWSLVIGVKSNRYHDTRVNNGLEYTYKISYVNSSGNVVTFKKTVKQLCLKAPKITLSCTPNSVMIVWNTFSTASQYRVYRKTVGDKQWQCIKVIYDKTQNYIMDYMVKPGQTYTYTIKQVKGDILGSYSLTGFSTKYTKAPTVNSKHSPKGVVLNWTNINSSYSYVIDHRSQTNPSWKTIATVSGKNTYICPYNKIDFGVVNYFRIRVKNTNMVSYSTSVNGIDPNKPMVALTYDDGPHATVTNSIVGTLKAYNARATFFVVGNRVNSYKTALKNAYNAGCEIGNHSNDHYILTKYKATTIKAQIDSTNNTVKAVTGKAPTIVRAPGGSINSTVKSNVKYPLIQWSVDTLDWKTRKSSSVVASVKSSTKDGSIILMHDLYSSTADATKEIVPWLKSKGYQMVTVTELLQIRGYDMKPGEVYYNGYKK